MRSIVLGAGGIGRTIASHLGAAGHEVILASRTAGAAEVPTARVDVADTAALTAAATGADLLVNAVNPPYTRWPELWPPLAASFLAAAESTGARLLTIGNLYPYGHADGPLREDTPERPAGAKGAARAAMWDAARAAQAEGRVRAVEVRASDYFGPGAGRGVSYLNTYVLGPAAAGKASWQVLGDPEAPRSWTYLPDIARLVVALAEADADGPDWGRVWHVPTASPRSMAEAAADAAAAAGVPARPVRALPRAVRRLLRVSPLIRELDETAPGFERPYVLDSAAAQTRFGLEPSPWDSAVAATVASLR